MDFQKCSRGMEENRTQITQKQLIFADFTRVHSCSSVANLSAQINSNHENLRPSPCQSANTKTPTLADRRFDADLGTTKNGLSFREGLDAGGAQPLGRGGAAFGDFDLLNVHIPFVAGGLFGPGPIVAKLGTFAALLTLCHNLFAPLLSCVRSFPPLCIRWLENLSVELTGQNSPNRFDTITV